MLLKCKEFVTINIMVILPHASYFPALAPCDFTSFPKWKMISDIKRELRAVLNSIKENYFHFAFVA
jgi:hypothetical protein